MSVHLVISEAMSMLKFWFAKPLLNLRNSWGNQICHLILPIDWRNIHSNRWKCIYHTNHILQISKWLRGMNIECLGNSMYCEYTPYFSVLSGIQQPTHLIINYFSQRCWWILRVSKGWDWNQSILFVGPLFIFSREHKTCSNTQPKIYRRILWIYL